MLLGFNSASTSVSNYHGPNYAYVINVNSAPLMLGAQNAVDMTILGNGTGYVGIGTTAPDRRLALSQSSGIDGISIYSNGTEWDIDNRANNEGEGNNFTIAGGSGPFPSFSISATTGYVGIQTVSPLAPLSVMGQVVIGGPYRGDAALHIMQSYGCCGRLTQINTTGNSLPAVNLMADTNSSGGNEWWAWGVNNNTWTIQPTTGFYGSTGLFINSSGNVGIGNTSPSATLEVNGLISADGGIALGTLGATNRRAIWLATVSDCNHAIYSDYGTPCGYTSPTGSNDSEYINYYGGLVFQPRATGTASYFNSAGNLIINGSVGIGKPSPLASLDVMGELRVSNTTGTGGDYDNYPVRIDAYYSGNAMKIFANSGNEYFGVYNYNQTALGLSGNVGVGVTTPNSKLQVNGALQVNSGGPLEIYFNDNGECCGGTGDTGIGHPGDGTLTFWSNNAVDMQIANNVVSVTGTITATSDRRLKQNIKPLAGALSKLDQLRGISFEWNRLSTSIGHKEGEKAIGMIAQEVQKVYPQLVVATKNGKQEYLSIDYGKFTAVLLQAIKEQQKEIEELQKKLGVDK